MKTTKLTNVVVTEYRYGPEAAGVRKCVICRGDLVAGEHWLKMTRPGQYAIGAHTGCLARNGHELDGAIAADTRIA